MADQASSELERALHNLFPGADLVIEPTKVRGHVPGARVAVHLYGEQLRLSIETIGNVSGARFADAIQLAAVPQSERGDALPVLAAEYFSPARQQKLRDAGVAFLDFAGNAWLVSQSVHVDRRGFGNQAREQRERRDSFSDKASLVLRVLLEADDPVGVRQIAEIVGASDEPEMRLTPGYVSKTVRELERRGYISRKQERIVLRRATELLSEWTVVYRNRRPSGCENFFVHTTSAEAAMPLIAHVLDDGGVDYIFTGHAGASLVDRYATFDLVKVYVRDIDQASAALEASGARRVQRGANLNLCTPYYKVSAFYGARVESGLRCASDIQLYLDLYHYPIRGREQAEHLYENRIYPLIEKKEWL